jgi:predicted nucleotidyltransferase
MGKNISDYNFIKKLQLLPFVEELWLFGSRSRGDHNQRSDIDLAIICPNANAKEWLDVIHIIEDADTLLKIDCIKLDKNTLSTDLYDNIIKDKKIIYAKAKN